jgi:branched-chain amino acid transport system ATP-binding protein
MLQIRNLTVNYGAISAVRGIDLDIAPGEIVALIGANGAGNTTVARAIAGLLPYQGDIVYGGQRLKPNSAERNLRRGLAMVPEGRGILSSMTVEENLLMGTYTRPDRAQATQDLHEVQSRFPILAERKSSMAGLLSGGEQQMLAIARALLSKPKLLLLDEPSLGLAPKIIDQIYEILLDLRQRVKLTLLINEQSSNRILKHADRIYVLRGGRMQLEGRAAELQDGEAIRHAYFGFGEGRATPMETTA